MKTCSSSPYPSLIPCKRKAVKIAAGGKGEFISSQQEAGTAKGKAKDIFPPPSLARVRA